MEENSLSDVCRACMTENGDFQSVFLPAESTGLNIHLAEMVMAYASVQITLGDGLPEQICTKCAKKVSEFYMFKLKCEETDRDLRSKFGKPPYSVIDDQTDEFNSCFDLAANSVDVIIKPEICAVDLEDTPNLINIEKQETDHFTENEDNEVVDKLPETEIIEIEKKIFFECDICNKCFPKSDVLVKHKKSHEYKVNQSDGELQSNDTIKDPHQIIEYVDLKSQYDIKCYETEEGYNEHLAVHRKPNDLTCEACNKKFTKPSHLTRHMVVHAAVKPYNCNLCNKGFGRAEQLSQHMNIHSGIKPHVCKICSKGFNQISNLKDHMRTHNGEKPFLCSTCGKGFNQLGNLRQHTVRHSGVKAHLCNTCGSGFASKGELSAHLRKHTGARPFVCSECNNGFTTSSSLTKHKRIHSGEKPYECEVCKMKFSRSGILARHKRTHTGEKPYVCNYCSKAFSQSNDLSSHLRIHTGEKPYVCDVCGQAFRQSSTLKKHKNIHMESNHTKNILSPKVLMVQKNYGMVHIPFLNSLE